VDAFLVLGTWLVLLPLVRRLSFGRLPALVAVAVASLGVPFVYDIVRYKLTTVLGRMVSVRSLWDLAGRDASVAATEVALQIENTLPLIVLALAGLAALLGLARAMERRRPEWAAAAAPPRWRSVLAGFGGCASVGALVFALPSASAARVQGGLVAKPGGRSLLELVRTVTDVDLDGFGLLSRPADPAPFDGSIHPFALDLPGNGIDENGVAGDHPPDFRPVEVAHAPPPGPGAPRPHLLIVFLESFRADLLERELDGVAITPFLNRLAREGAASRHAYVHTPYTVGSRAQFFGGRLYWKPGQDSLVDDFQARGYTVAHFSGQDDSLGGSAGFMGADRADVYYDARQDEDARTSRTRNETALQVSWKTLAKRVDEFLARHDPAQPLLLYVNLVDTHFPYDHLEMERILGGDPIARHSIRAERADEVFATYANAAANVDRGVERITESWWSRLGRDTAILVTADHGQSFYENGVLGHGQFLDESHTRVPFVVWGMGGTWPEPLGLGDVRALLRRNLLRVGGSERAAFVPDPGRRIFQFVPRLERPRKLGLRAYDGAVEYVVASRRLRTEGSTPPWAEGEGVSDEIVRTWEAYQLRLEGAAP
jgi:hypothetical protein